MTSADIGVDLSKYDLGWSDEEDYLYKPKKGLNTDIINEMSWMKGEPAWMRDLRLKSHQRFEKRPMPNWGGDMSEIYFDDIFYYIKPTESVKDDWDDIPDAIKDTYEKLGIPEAERKYLAGVTAQYESEVVYHRNREDLEELGVIFCDMDTALREYPQLVKEYFGTIIPPNDNKFSALNTAVWSGGSFIYVPPGVHVDQPLQAYFRINAENMGQFERTLIIADKGSYVSYLEGCTAPQRDESQLHAAVVEIIIEEDAEVKYSTVQNWYPGDEDGKGGIYNFVTKRADCRGDRAKVMWTQVETGSAVTWKYPSCILRGDDSQGEFYSIAIANNMQQADTGTKMVHLGKRTKSRIVSKGISAGKAQNTYRGLVSMHPKAKDSRNYTQCDSLLIGDKCGAHTVPYIEVKNNSSRVEHEATTSKVDDEQLFYCRSRGMDEEEAVALVVNGFCKDVLQALPMEFAMEAQALVAISLEGSVG